MSGPQQRAHAEDRSRLPDRVVVACTATLHGNGSIRLPDRQDTAGRIAAFLVETSDQARELLQEIDTPGRTVFVDVERKQAVDLPMIAEKYVQSARIQSHKPNDATIRSLDVLISHLIGFDLSGQTIGVFGTGNIGFKAALLFAERSADVVVYGRDPKAAHRTVEAIQPILPRYGTSHVAVWKSQPVDVLVTALAAKRVVGVEWLALLLPNALVVDVGIGNLSADFIGGALAVNKQIVRLDTRISGAQLAMPAPGFFEDCFGRREVEGVTIVSGGIIGTRGTVVVDSYARPTRILGVADGMGALVHNESLSQGELGAVSFVEKILRQSEAGR